MLADNLYERFGRPDLVISEHDSNDVAAGNIAIKGGPLLASSTGINVTIRGIGGHGSRPELGKDPIVLSAEFILIAQTIVSRQIDPQQPAVLTVGIIHGGTKNNIIPDEVDHRHDSPNLFRPCSRPDHRRHPPNRQRTRPGLRHPCRPHADRQSRAKALRPPERFMHSPIVCASAAAALGADHVEQAKAVMGSEDVGLFTLDGKIPGVMFWLGAADPAKLAESRKTGVPLPSAHSALFAPVYAPAIKTGVTAMTAMSLDLLK